jgi:hypothetical protein
MDNQKHSKAGMRQQMDAADAHYYADKLDLRGHGAHEGWIKAKKVQTTSNASISTEARHEMIATDAYSLAEKRGFAGYVAKETG